MPRKKDQNSAPEALAFEEAMARVESIVEAMEADTLQLEEMLSQYEEGSRLLTLCQQRIDGAQKRIEIIASKRNSAGVTLKEFDSSLSEHHSDYGDHEGPVPKEPQLDQDDQPATLEEDGDADEIRLF